MFLYGCWVLGSLQWQVAPFQLISPQAQTSIVMPLVKWSLHKNSLIKLFTQFRHNVQNHSLTLTMDFSYLWKHCYRFTYATFHTFWNYVTYCYHQSLSRCITLQDVCAEFNRNMWPVLPVVSVSLTSDCLLIQPVLPDFKKLESQI